MVHELHELHGLMAAKRRKSRKIIGGRMFNGSYEQYFVNRLDYA